MVKNDFKLGDTIKCTDAEEAAYVSEQLGAQGIDTDFIYELDGKKGLWVIVVDWSQMDIYDYPEYLPDEMKGMKNDGK